MSKQSFKPKKVLLTQARLNNYAGSEIAILELAEYFSSIGAQVWVLTHYYGGPIQDDFSQLSDVEVVRTTEERAKVLQDIDFDLIWIQHNVLTPELIRALQKGISRPKIVYSHLSFVEPLELPIMIDAELQIGDVFTFNSNETYKNITDEGFVFPKDNVFVLGNPAPDSFFINKEQKRGRPGRLAIVSNHPPQELIDASKILEDQGVVVDFYGKVKQGKQLRITRELLEGYDAVVSIGKTVQYCMAMQKPIYIYDRFGGPGFLGLKNFGESQDKNFSGRGYEQKTSEDIAMEITDTFEEACYEMVDIYETYADSIRFSSVMKKLFIYLEKAAQKRESISKKNEASYVEYQKLMKSILPVNSRYIYQINDVENKFSECRKELSQANKHIKYLKAEIARHELVDGWLSVRLERKARKIAGKVKRKLIKS